MQAEKTWHSFHNYLYRELIRDFDDERRIRKVSTTMSGDPATWRYIDFDPYEAWLGRLEKSFLDMQVETWECNERIWDDRYYYEREDEE